MNLDVSGILVIGGFAVTIAFNAGIQWAFVSALRKDMNGYKTAFQAHEKGQNTQVLEFSERVSKLEGKAE